MPSLNFKKQFAPLVVAGTKPHTIRAMRKRPFKQGDTLSFFTGSRFKPQRIRAKTTCTAAVEISIFSNEQVLMRVGSRFYTPTSAASSWFVLTTYQIHELARRDGFANREEFFAYFIPRIPRGDREFRGQLIEWDPSK